jgi:putative thiamine transport system ATP-binding protein
MRALLAEPQALLLDEPFAKLDMALRAQFRALVFRHVAERGIPTLLVTHDPADVPQTGGVSGRVHPLEPPHV